MTYKHSNFPGGFNPGALIRGLPIVPAHGAKVFWVGNNNTLLPGERGASDSSSNRGGFLDPYSTIEYAQDQCVANRGDIIYVRPNYTQAVSTADIDLDVNGVTFVGLGYGTTRPTITYTGTTDTTTVDISANNVRLFNFLFNFASNDAVDDGVIINGTDVELAYCEFRANATAQPDVFLTIGKADADADRAWVHDNKFVSLTAGANSAISIDFDMDNMKIKDNYIDGDWVDAGISIPTGGNACTNLVIDNNYIRNRQTGDHAIEIAAVTSGVLVDNYLVADTLTAIVSSVANMVYLNNEGQLADSSTTGPAGGSFLVPAHYYPRQVLTTRQVTGSMATGYATTDDPVEFTVSGAIKVVNAYGVVTTALTSTATTGTISLGVADDENLLCEQVTANGTNMAVGDIWATTATTVNGDRTLGSGAPAIIGAGVDIKSFVATNDMTAGNIDIYLEWVPLESTSNVVAAG